MAIKLLYSYQLTNPKSGVAVSLTSTKSARGRPIEAAPGFVRLRKDIQHSCSSKSVRCVMSDTSLHEGAVGVAYKDGVVIVDHGSRRQESNVLLNEFVMMFKNKTGYPIVEPAHMELAEPSIRDAFGSCVQQGASRVIISPFFLFPGRHWNQDIPLLAEAAASEYPGIPYLVTAPLGLHELLVDVMKDRIDYCLSHVDGKVDECAVCAGTGKCKIKVQDSKT
ncbi:sirohydrochlorin ferrochelatase, chloroplastic-like [Silene latifolia]|uniref:sirohydrochlorin ferrochelatase, chloroplastic-like n=1 Tax=Silene latifolia TaxID=37657 RepID=UPI003D775E89